MTSALGSLACLDRAHEVRASLASTIALRKCNNTLTGHAIIVGGGSSGGIGQHASKENNVGREGGREGKA